MHNMANRKLNDRENIPANEIEMCTVCSEHWTSFKKWFITVSSSLYDIIVKSEIDANGWRVQF